MKKNLIFSFILILFVANVYSNIFGFNSLQTPVKTEAKDLTLGDVSTSRAKLTYSVCGDAVTEIGVCYGTSLNPTPSSDKNTIIDYQGDAIDVPVKVDYKARIGGLEQGKEYFVRAYVKNESGKIFYSNEVSFKTEKDKTDYDAMLNGPKKEYYVNGNVMKEYTLKDGQVDGELKFYDDSARLVADEYIKNGLQNGVCKYYYKNGQLQREISLRDGIQNGFSREYDPDGTLRTESELTASGDPIQFTGEVKHFNEEGNLIEQTSFSNGKLIYSIHKDNQGRTTSEQMDGSRTDYSYDNDGWKHTSANGEKCTCSRCSSN